MKLKIEKNIPIPPKERKKTALTVTDVLRQMKVGDSIKVPKRLRNQVSALGIYVFGKGSVTVRTLSASHARVWRVK
jgi:hypothetical protein